MRPHVKYVLISGAAGGVVSWVYSYTLGIPFAIPKVFALITCSLLGAAAALVSVYVVANTDTRDIPRLIAFAVLCGIFWKPAIDSSLTFVNQKRDAAVAHKEAMASVEEAKAAPTAEKAEAVKKAAEESTILLATADRLNDPRLEDAAVSLTHDVIEQSAATASADPVGAKAVLENIHTAAVQANQEGLARQSMDALNAIRP